MKKTTSILALLALGVVLLGCRGQGDPLGNPSPSESPPELFPAATPTEGVITAAEARAEPATEAVPAATAEPLSLSTPEPTAIPCSGEPTSPQQEGPFFSPGSPERESLIEPGMAGVPVLVRGRVFDADCRPISGAKLDFWLADVNGEYDNQGYRLRGHVFTDQEGNYSLETIEPTSYTGRPPHIHVKVYAPGGGDLLTTQMYFAGSEASGEVLASPELAVRYLEPDPDGRLNVLFSFVVAN